ncbi:hypothetical protein K438DRAFT_1928976 [Mycena galopus ATCC 62051]|nr:hypothetical protein K438DRAFT_1928976 [Mycena galopus ATCC 62051]
MTQLLSLPQELFDHIIDQLFDDLETLRSCALVSSNFLLSSRPHIFSHLRVGHLDQEHTVGGLQDIFARLPHLNTRVQSLHLWDHIMRRHSWMEEWPASLAPGVAQFLHTLSMKRFAITIESGFVHWANVSEALCTSIHLVLSTQTLTCLELTGLYGLPFTLFANCPRLKSVTLKWITFDERDNLDFATTLAACKGSPLTLLNHLSIDLDRRVLEFLSRWILHPESPLKITQLTSFECTLDGRLDYITVQRLLDECSSTLEHFRLKNIDGTLDLSAFAHLHTMRIDTVEPLEPRVRWLASSIMLPPQPISIVIRMKSEIWSPEVLQLAAADAVLAQFHSIASVTLLLVPQNSAVRERERDLIDVSTTFAQRMPSLARKGTLRVLRSPHYANP